MRAVPADLICRDLVAQGSSLAPGRSGARLEELAGELRAQPQHRLGLQQRVVELVEGYPEVRRQLVISRRALQLGLELHVDSLDLPRPSADRAGHPVERPQLIDDRPTDAGDGVGLELDLTAEIEPFDG